MQRFKLIISFVIPILLVFIPIEGISVIEKRVIGIFVMAALLWILEPIPIYATSVLIIVLELITISDKGLIFFRETTNPETFGELLDYKSIFATFASPIILLFMGGFF